MSLLVLFLLWLFGVFSAGLFITALAEKRGRR